MEQSTRPFPQRMLLEDIAAAGLPVRLRAWGAQMWCLRVLMVGFPLVAMAYVALLPPPSSPRNVVYLLPILALLGAVLFRLEVAHLHHRRRGFVLAIEPKGVRFWDLPAIPWDAVLRADTREAYRPFATRPRPHLVLTLERRWFEVIRDRMPDPGIAYAGHVDEATSRVFLSLKDVDCSMEQVDEIAAQAMLRHRRARGTAPEERHG
jgi:hypothetical protein